MPLPDLSSSIRVVGNIPPQLISSATVTGGDHPEANKRYIYLRDVYDAYLIVDCGSVGAPIQVKLQHSTEAAGTYSDVTDASDIITVGERFTQHIYKINCRGRSDGPYYRASILVGGGGGGSFVGATLYAAWPKDNLLDGDLAMTSITANW